MRSERHNKHIATRVSHSDCCECRADTERRFTTNVAWKYQHVHDYLEWAKPRLQAIRTLDIQHGGTSVDARVWYRKFIDALQRRISLKVPTPIMTGRKYCDSYLDRLKQFPRDTDVAYLKRFASRGASCLDW